MKLSAKTHLILTSGVAFLFISMMAVLFWQGNDLLVKRTPVLEAAERIKAHTSTGHMWFEEIISGDSSEQIEDVWWHLDQAEWYVDALLTGADNGAESIYPLQTPELRRLLYSLRSKLDELRTTAQIRYRNRDSSFAGTDIDKQSDILFRRYNAEIDQIMGQFKGMLRQDIRRYQFIGILLILASAIIAFVVNRSLYLKEMKSHTLMASLTQANIEIERKNQSLHKQAHFDHLTGLPNRTLFLDRLEQAIGQAERDKATLAVVFIDLDYFKQVNDQYGHHTGDRLLEMVSKRIQGTIRSTDTAARISGDEFTVILRGMPDSDTAVKTSSKIAEQLVATVASPYQIDGVNVGISASIGIALYPDDSTVMDVLVRHADNAMYHAKSRGKNNYQFYSEELNTRSVDLIALESELKAAITEDQFVVYYQPRWDFASGKLSGIEALLRWQHPERGLLLPETFIPLAESCGTMDALDLLVVEKVLQQMAVWQVEEVEFAFITVNLSCASFKQQRFLANLCLLISESAIDNTKLEIEINEKLLTGDVGAQQIVNRLKLLGVRLSLDNFGMGATSLRTLKDYPLNTLKIDRSYIQGPPSNTGEEVVLKHLISMAKELGVDVVAQGVETEEEQKKLQAIGCNLGQGHRLTQPLDANALAKLLKPKPASNIVPFSRG